MKNVRHGDLVLFQIEKLPAGLKASSSKALMRGSHGNDHTFDRGEFYMGERDDNIIGYLKAYSNTKLYHPDHGNVVKGKPLREVAIQAGIYELRRQIEDTHEGMRPVID